MRSSGGPCDHCGTSSTPCWRRGPPGKETLCNACGARFLVKKNLDGYFPSSTTPRQLAYTAKQPRVKARKPRSASYTAFQDKVPAAQRRSSVGKASKKGLSPAAQAAYAQLAVLRQLEQHAMRLASGGSQPPLFQPPPGQQPPTSLLLQRSGSTPLTQAGGAAPQLTVLSPIDIQVKVPMPAKVSLFTDAGASLRRRARKPGSPSRAAT